VFILKGIMMFKRLRLNSAKSRLVEERLYEMVMDELETGNIRRGIWAKAVAKSNGNDNQARSKYLELRVESLKDEAHVIQSILESEENKPKHDLVKPKPDLVEPKPDLVEPKPDLVEPKHDLVEPNLWRMLWVFTTIIILFIILKP
jgi:hypothetical protein